MNELYLQRNGENLPIHEDVIRKYHLHAGPRSPFTRSCIVDKNGRRYDENELAGRRRADVDFADEDDGAGADGGVALSTSEILDFAQGADS